MASLIKMINITSLSYYPREAYAFLDAQDDPISKAVVGAIASAPVQAASQKALTLLEQYSSFLIPAVGVAFQLYISSKARGWAEAKKVKEEEAAAVRKAEKNKTGIAPFEPKVEAGGKKGKK